MNIKNIININMLLAILLSISLKGMAEEIYQWTDEEGNVNFGNLPPEGTPIKVAYRSHSGDKAYQWIDLEGNKYLSDVPPTNRQTNVINEISIGEFSVYSADLDEYSIVNQARRMTDYRLQLVEARREKQRQRYEKHRQYQEQKILRMEEQLRTQGYGPRPYYSYTY